MKRDDDYLRELMLRYEADQDWLFIMPGVTKDASYEERKECYHVLQMMDVGFATQVGKNTFRITAQGHDYLDAIRDQGIWEKTKAVVAETGSNATLEIVKALALGFLKKKISQNTGIEL